MPRATKCNVTARGAAALGNWSSIRFRGGGGANVHLIRAKIVARMGWRRGFWWGAWQRQAASRMMDGVAKAFDLYCHRLARP